MKATTLFFFVVLGTTMMTDVAAQSSWIRSPLNASPFYEHEIASENFIELSSQFQVAAQKLLKKSTLIKINFDAASQYGGDKLPLNRNKNFYLVRGVRTGNGGKFFIYQFGNELLVMHGDLGKPKELVVRRTVLLVSTDTPILRTFATYSLAE